MRKGMGMSRHVSLSDFFPRFASPDGKTLGAYIKDAPGKQKGTESMTTLAWVLALAALVPAGLCTAYGVRFSHTPGAAPRKSSDGTCGGFHPCAFSRRLWVSGPFFGLGHP